MPKGSVGIFLSTVWHGGGANRTDKPRMALGVLYGEPYIRTLENVYGAVQPKQVARMSPRLQRLLGYSVVSPNIGNIDGKSPLRRLDPESPEGYKWMVRPDMQGEETKSKL
jgi:ectoine hydroxylase-related dioxygenase (phytanoyl-CoA dioxygenase family)